VIQIYFTYFRYQHITPNASQKIWILIQHLPHRCRHLHLVNQLHVMWLKLLGSKLFLIPKTESALAGTNRLVKDRYRKSGSMQEFRLWLSTQHGTCYAWQMVVVWLSGNTMVSINKGALHRARSVPRWVTVLRRFGAKPATQVYPVWPSLCG